MWNVHWNTWESDLFGDCDLLCCLGVLLAVFLGRREVIACPLEFGGEVGYFSAEQTLAHTLLFRYKQWNTIAFRPETAEYTSSRSCILKHYIQTVYKLYI